MKTSFLFIAFFFMLAAAYCQQGKKTDAGQKPPTQKELEEMKKEMQKAMDDMSPEDKKMLDSMGFKMPSLNSIPTATDKQLADGWQQETNPVPPKNVAKIASIPATPNATALPAFVTTIHNAVALALSPTEKTDAESLYEYAKSHPDVGTANAAISLWIQSRPMPAVFLMGKACQAEPGNINNLNNYAAMLTMTGAEQAAIPILQNLNKRFPNNSTVLNNLGQAWFGLGDLDNASRYLDSAIRVYSYHSQANFTKCLIEEKKGNTEAAIAAMLRSIRKNHSPEKESKLRELGKSISGNDIDFPFKMPQDPLGLEKFHWPEYPMTVVESAVQEEKWRTFIDECEAELRELNSKLPQVEKNAADAMGKRTTALIAASQSLKPYNPLPWYAARASLKLNYLVEDKDNGLQFRLEKSQRGLAEAVKTDAEFNESRITAEKALAAKYDPLIGEGRANPLEQYCNAVNKVRNEYLQLSNSQLKSAQERYINDQRRLLNDQVYYAQYINWPEDFELIKITAKIKWLNIIKTQVVKFQSKGPLCKNAPDANKLTDSSLSAFDDVACQYHSSIDLGIMEFNNDCSRFEGKLKLGAVNYTRKIDSDDHNRLLAASLEIKVGASKDADLGPVQAEAKAEITGKMEWNEDEITNWEISSEINVSAGSNLGHGDRSIDVAGVKAQIGMNSGSSVTGKGLLGSINISRP